MHAVLLLCVRTHAERKVNTLLLLLLLKRITQYGMEKQNYQYFIASHSGTLTIKSVKFLGKTMP